MSLKANPLQTKHLRATVSAVSSVAERVRLRIRDEMSRKHLSQRDVANLLGSWSQSRVAKLLSGRVKITLDDLEALCFAVGISPTEAVRDRGLEFCAELTPTELRLLECLRERPPAVMDAVKTLIQITPTSIEQRGATSKKKLLGNPRR